MAPDRHTGDAERSHSESRQLEAAKSNYWIGKAENNVEKWGLQDIETLLLAMQEEMGELAQAYLEASAEEGDEKRILEELDDLAALCFQLQWALTSYPFDADTDRPEVEQ